MNPLDLVGQYYAIGAAILLFVAVPTIAVTNYRNVAPSLQNLEDSCVMGGVLGSLYAVLWPVAVPATVAVLITYYILKQVNRRRIKRG